MLRILFATHGPLCQGMLDTIRVFMADVENIEVIPFYSNDPTYDAEQELEDFGNRINEDDIYLVFTDILWGSVNQKIVVQLNHKENVHIITGINLPLVLELLTINPETISKDSLSERVKSCRESIVYMKEYEITFNSLDE